MLRIFISYSTQDIWAVDAVRQAVLDRKGVGVFFAEESIRVGEDLPERIRRNLAICDVFLLLWSSSAARSDWVKAEIGAAWGQKRLIIPVHLEPDVPLPGPLSGRSVKDISLHEDPEVALRQLAAAIHDLAHDKTVSNAWGWGIAGVILGGLLLGGDRDDE